ncbi:glycoside hydrolase family protein [Pontiella agarivorans]|uniref:Glycoside hydrolase family protein n=1 Tax=Pontiella agarivorans TaxID=3038953 RepID=A0ABU5MW56_9BACT|nr:glycoside hydrolase family protein [Pontiella agarivorans]MDZ8118449.1 glycoside hydrolase family protein [Pontiella agarivorans]
MRLLLQPVPDESVFCDSEYFIWGASMVRDPEGWCHLFYSRWKKEYGFNAWVSHSEVAHAVSENPTGPYRHVDVALSARGTSYWDGCCTHNPTVHEADGRFYLFYMGNTGDGKREPDSRSWNWTHRNNQRIGVAVAEHPSGPWKRMGQPLIAPDESELMVSNPAVARRPGDPWTLIYKAVKKERPLPFGGPVVHRVAFADNPAGPFRAEPLPIFGKNGDDFPAEDPFLWFGQDGFRIILKDMNGSFSGMERSLVMLRSADAINWDLSEVQQLSGRSLCFENGEMRTFDFLERAQLFIENGEPSILFCAARSGTETMNLHIPLTMIHEDETGQGN